MFDVSLSSWKLSLEISGFDPCTLLSCEILQILINVSWAQLARRRSPPSEENNKKINIYFKSQDWMRTCSVNVKTESNLV